MGETGAAIDALIERLLAATKDTVGLAARDVQTGARAIAPARAGNLRNSIEKDGPREAATVDDLPKSAPRGPAVFAARVGPTVVYGRIREVGGHVPGLRTVMTHPALRWEWNGRPVFWHVGTYSYTSKKTGRTIYRRGRGRQMQHGEPYMATATEPVRRGFHNMLAAALGRVIEEM